MIRRPTIRLVLVLALAALGACSNPDYHEAATPDSELGRETVDVIQDLTDVLSGIHNLPQAEETLPQLERLGDALTTALARSSEYSPEHRRELAEAVRVAAEPLNDEVNRVQEIAGVPGTLQPMLDSIREKVAALRQRARPE